MAGGNKMMHAGGDGRSNGVSVSEEISREVVRVERWNGRAIAVWMIVQKRLMCVISVYGPHTGRTEAEKQDFRDEVEKMMGLVEVGTMLCVAGYFNAHVGVAETGDEESIGRYGWGTRNREGQDLVEMVMRNGLVVAGSFVQKKRQSQSDIQKWKPQNRTGPTSNRKANVRKSRIQGRKTINWWTCTEGMVDEYKERVKIKYEELDTEVEAAEEEWKKYKDYFEGVAEEMCGRTSGKGGMSKNQEWWTDEVARAVDEKRDVWKKNRNDQRQR